MSRDGRENSGFAGKDGAARELEASLKDSVAELAVVWWLGKMDWERDGGDKLGVTTNWLLGVGKWGGEGEEQELEHKQSR
jgi:hypothetical protein